ncbi:ferric iron reductase [Streptomyces tsukubensis]|uniref:Iron-sulfur protein n=1 Tax=Streptomyces tsukubensis TaxID=83656 RepID=A0A1V4ABC7_9ACTN|nr:ferric iron reductase [Streptomyces tsukubensis]OON80719.1 iron-sulfur protein [Streptomyces tsukubensis]QFR96310.1 iron-sulfur protein [Streptomyces tsukubensis]
MPLPAPAPVQASSLVPSGLPFRSAVADAYDRLAEVLPSLRVTELATGQSAPAGAGWVSAAALAEGGPALDAFLAWDSAQILRDYGQRARPDVVAGFGLHRYAWSACLLVTVPWFLLRRVPRLSTEQVSYHRTLGRMAVHTDSFACLPDDPAAGETGARVVPDEEALRREVRDAVGAHLAPLFTGFGPLMRRGPRALWGMATDEIAEGLWYAGRLLGEEERATAELGLLLPGATKPYVGTAGFRLLTGHGGEKLPTRDRASCCMYYTLRPEDTCVTCPRTCDADRVARLSEAASA